MVRDITGRRVKKHLNGFEQFYMERFYINNNKVYQIVRVKKIHKFNGDIVEVTYKQYNSNKVKSVTISLEAFEERKYYTNYKKALTFTV